MFTIGYDELKNKPMLGKTIVCPHCGEDHEVKNAKDAKTGLESSTLQFYHCGEKTYLAGVKGRAT